MKYAIYTPHFGGYADAQLLADLAQTAEAVGWDGFFIWDHVAVDWPDPVVDVTAALTAIALNTSHIRFGAMVTPMPRRRPSKFARETVTLDQLSNGRLIAGVGIGIFEGEYAGMGEPPDFKTRAEMLDEGLEVLTGLWGGEPWNLEDRFTHHGRHYTVEDALFWPKPIQQPRIPIWIAGMWPNKAPFRRAARWDGVFPIHSDFDNQSITPEHTRDIAAYIQEHRTSGSPFDIAISGSTAAMSPQEALDHTTAQAEAGATWWQESIGPIFFDWEPGPSPWPMDKMLAHIEAGPPKEN